MPTDNRTNEQIVAEELSYVTDECSCHRSTAEELAQDAVAALTEAGRLAGEQLSGNPGQLTEAQVEAAAKAYDAHWGVFPDEYREYTCRGCGHLYATEEERRSGIDGEGLRKAVDSHRMRAALVAAQGAAPQAECTEAPGGRPCEASKPGHKLHYSNGGARGE